MTVHKTWLNWQEEGPNTEKNTLPSETQPDMAMSLQDLLERHVRGLDVPYFEGQYQNEEDDFIPEPGTLDMVDFLMLARQNEQKIAEMQQALQDESEAIRKQQRPIGQESAEGDKPPVSGGKTGVEDDPSTNPS